MARTTEKSVLFFLEKYMEKIEKNKEKTEKTVKKIWVQIPQPLDKRTTSSGVVFCGKYISKPEV